MFTAHATAMKYIGRLESPRPRKTDAMMLYAVISGTPRKQMRRYATVPDTASAGVDMTAAIGRASASSSPVTATLSTRNSVIALPV